MKAQILLSTWNGAAYLKPFLESLAAQERPLPLLWRDDGSRDDTVALVRKWAKTYKPGVTEVKKDFSRNLGVISSFDRLARASRAPAVFFADQDDRWLPAKTRVCLEALDQAEARHGKSTPLLVHHDLMVVDGMDRLLHPSFWSQQGLDPRRNDLRYLLLQNFVTGCATLVNRPLLKTALPLPAACRMHDWWLGQVAAATGHLVPLSEPLVRYRQHGGNTIGAGTWTVKRLWGRLWDADGRHRKSLADSSAQAGALAEKLRSLGTVDRLAMLEAFADFPKKTWFGRRGILWRHGISRHSLPRLLWLYLTV